MGAVELGGAVQRRRAELGINQVELATQLGMSRQWMSKFELGRIGQVEPETIDALASALSWSAEALERHLDPTIRMGVVRRRARRQRASVPLSGAPPPEFASNVAILGDVSAGEGAPITGYTYVEHSYAASRNLYAVRVRGTCMAPQILDGDVVLFDASQVDPRNGQLVVATVESATSEAGDGVVKRWYRTPDGIELVPLVGDSIKVAPGEVHLHGVVVELRRRIG